MTNTPTCPEIKTIDTAPSEGWRLVYSKEDGWNTAHYNPEHGNWALRVCLRTTHPTHWMKGVPKP